MAAPVHSCTTAVISGRATVDGRPILWKNRDTSHRHNEVVILDDGQYRAVAVVNAGSRTSVWMGVNAAGLCIENSLSKDLADDDNRSGPRNGQMMKRILQTCATVAEMKQVLEDSNQAGRGTVANFGVIDAHGGAALFEVGPKSFTMFDANDPATAPEGYIVRTNFATTARQLPPVPDPEDVTGQDLYSSKRFCQACRRLEEAADRGLSVDFVLRSMTRDLSDLHGQAFPGSVNGPAGTLPAIIPTDQTISRTTTVSAAVFHGVHPGEDPALTTMWTMLGDPKFTIAVPCWVGVSQIADPLTDVHGAEIGEIAITLRGWCWDRQAKALVTEHLPGIWNDLWAAEDQILEDTLSCLARWRSQSVSSQEMAQMHLDASQTAMRAMSRELEDMKRTIFGDDWIAPDNVAAQVSLSDDGASTRETALQHFAADNSSEVSIGVYADAGAGASLEDLIRAVQQIDSAYVTRLTAEDIRSGALQEVDLLLHPGGSGSRQGRQLGHDGRQAIRHFVRSGGGFIGFCAGAYLASADYDWSLNLLDARVLDREHWARGTGNVEVQFTEFGQQVFGLEQSGLEIYYGQGPLLAPARHEELPDYSSLAIYSSEVAKKGAPEGMMPGTTAIAHGTFGQGEVVCFSPHPEKTEGLAYLVHRAVRLVARDQAASCPQMPSRDLDAIPVTPDFSQRGLPNSQYCAPCATANMLVQFDRRQQLDLPEEYAASADTGNAADGEAGEFHRSLPKLLGNPCYMDSLGHHGTNRYRLIDGLSRFVRFECQTDLSISYLGIRNYDEAQLSPAHRPQILATVGVPRVEHLKRSLAVDEGVLILFGSYKPRDERRTAWERLGGHYVVVVGYDDESDAKDGETTILLHDSNDAYPGIKRVQSRSMKQEIELWTEGELLSRSSRLVQLENAPIRKDGRIAFLETIFSFRPEPPKASSRYHE